MGKDINNTFVRYGKLHLVKQEGYGEDTFHAPPAPKGFYAMPIKFQEMFIVGSVMDSQPKIFNVPKRFFEDVIDFEECEKDRKKRMRDNYHKFVVDDTGEIWHHLDVKRSLILDEHGTWFKTTVANWKKALRKENIKLRSESLKFFKDNNINNVKKYGGFFSKDHFEVFFDTKVC